MAVEFVRHRFSLMQFERMVETGVLTSDDRVELISGDIVEKMTPSSDHSVCINLLAEVLMSHLAGRAAVRTENPIRLPPDSSPEPDVALVLPPPRRYLDHHPEPADVLLVVEVAQTSGPSDRRAKVPLYAAGGIVEVWLVDLRSQRIEVYRAPRDGEYTIVTLADRGGSVSPLAFPDVVVAVDDVLP